MMRESFQLGPFRTALMSASVASSPASVTQGVAQLFDGAVAPDGESVNTTQPPYQPSGVPPAAGGNLDLTDPTRHTLHPMREKNVGETMSAKGVSWAWYAGGWNAALADGRRDPKAPREVIYASKGQAFQPHHQPFNYFARFAPGTADRAQHLKDGEDFVADIQKGTLPKVAFYKPVGRLNQHPSYTNLADGDEHIHHLLTRLRASPQWSKMLVIVTYDENGGFWDHVPPPSGAGWGDRFGLEPLPGVRPKAGDLTNALE